MDIPECFACGEATTVGLGICGQILCPDCEARLTHTKVEQLEYQHWVESCRRFWKQLQVDLEADSVE